MNGYNVEERVSRIKHIKNIRDNAAYIVSMFDYYNQNKLLEMATSEETKEYLKELLRFGRGESS